MVGCGRFVRLLQTRSGQVVLLGSTALVLLRCQVSHETRGGRILAIKSNHGVLMGCCPQAVRLRAERRLHPVKRRPRAHQLEEKEKGRGVVERARNSCFLGVGTHPLQFVAGIVFDKIAALTLPRHFRTTRRGKAAFTAMRDGA